MQQLLRSLGRINRATQQSERHFQAHIFFDNGVRHNRLTPFALQLIAVALKTLGKTSASHTAPQSFRPWCSHHHRYSIQNGYIITGLRIIGQSTWYISIFYRKSFQSMIFIVIISNVMRHLQVCKINASDSHYRPLRSAHVFCNDLLN